MQDLGFRDVKGRWRVPARFPGQVHFKDVQNLNLNPIDAIISGGYEDLKICCRASYASCRFLLGHCRVLGRGLPIGPKVVPFWGS